MKIGLVEFIGVEYQYKSLPEMRPFNAIYIRHHDAICWAVW